MKTENNIYRNYTDFKGRTFEATLNMDRLSLVIEGLAKNYVHPEHAILREWVSNAHDSHIEAGQTRPVEVTLPTEFNPTFTVRDFGIGMSLEEFENIYVVFGSTTKDESNEVIGGKGIGAKSALAVADQYTVSTIKDGLKNVFILERSPNGGVQVKTVIENEPTDEPNGLTASVIIERIEQLNARSIGSVLAGWSNEDVLINGGNETFYSFVDNSFPVEGGRLSNAVFAPRPQTKTAKNYKAGVNYEDNAQVKEFSSYINSINAHQRWERPLVVAVSIGPVMYYYDLPARSFEELNISQAILDFVVLDIPIGKVTFPSSREVIEPSRANTAIIMKAFKKVAIPIREAMTERVAAATTEKEVLDLYTSTAAAFIYDSIDFYGEVSYNFHGEEIPMKIHLDTAIEGYKFKQTGRSWKKNLNYQISLVDSRSNYEFGKEVDAREVQYLIICENGSSTQTLRNLFRKYVAQKGIQITDLIGYLAFDPTPSRWALSAVENVITEKELRETAKLFTGSTTKTSGSAKIDNIRNYKTTRYELEQKPSSNDSVKVVERVTWGELLDSPDFDNAKPIVFASTNESINWRALLALVRIGILNEDDFHMVSFNTTAQVKTLSLPDPGVKLLTTLQYINEVIGELTVDPRVDNERANAHKALVLDDLHSYYRYDNDLLFSHEELDPRFETLVFKLTDNVVLDHYSLISVNNALDLKFGKFTGLYEPATHEQFEIVKFLMENNRNNDFSSHVDVLVKHVNFAVENYFKAIKPVADGKQHDSNGISCTTKGKASKAKVSERNPMKNTHDKIEIAK